MSAPGRTPHSLHLGPVAAVATLFAIVLTAMSAPTSVSEAPTIQASHVNNCNVSFDAAGDMLLDGETLTPEEEASLQEILHQSVFPLEAVLDVAADPDAEACVYFVPNLAAPVDGVFNADIRVCGDVVRDGERVVVDGVEVNGVLTSDFLDALGAAAAASVDTCVDVSVTREPEIGTSYGIHVEVALCALTTLLADVYVDRSRVRINAGGDEFVFENVVLVDPDNLLEIGVGRLVKFVTGSFSVENGSSVLVLTISECPALFARPAPDPAGVGSAGIAANATPAPLIPDTSVMPAGTGGRLAVLLLLLAILGHVSVAVATGPALSRSRGHDD